MTLDPMFIPAVENTATGGCESNRKVAMRDEHRLVAAAKRGQTAAFDALCHPHSKVLFQRTYRITKNREDAEDAVQDSFLRAFVHMKKFDGRSSFSTWLTRIAINSALMILRKNRSSREIAMEVPGELGETGFEWQVADHSPNPEQKYAEREKENFLRSAIRDLRPAVREVVETQQLQELSMKETASRMGISVGAAKARLFHGRAKLRNAFHMRTGKCARAKVYRWHAARSSSSVTSGTR